jgi:hypothetical protein
MQTKGQVFCNKPCLPSFENMNVFDDRCKQRDFFEQPYSFSLKLLNAEIRRTPPFRRSRPARQGVRTIVARLGQNLQTKMLPGVPDGGSASATSDDGI